LAALKGNPDAASFYTREQLQAVSASWAAKARAPAGRSRCSSRRAPAARANGASISANGTPRHRASASRSSAAGLAGGRGAGAYDRLLEAFEVELAVGDANQAAGRPA